MSILVETKQLTKEYVSHRSLFRPRAHVRAVDRVSLTIQEGECLGLIGESGSGKSTFARLILALLHPTGGDVCFRDQSLTALPPGQMRGMRKHMQFVPQDPYGSLNPRMRIGELIGESLRLLERANREEAEARAMQMLETVGLSRHLYYRYPHQLSGGQRQRVSIAAALVTHPALVVADEPTSSLDVSIQAQILNLLMDLQEAFSLTYLFISHNLNVIGTIADRVAVMVKGRVIEVGATQRLLEDPIHPYTRHLRAASPSINDALTNAPAATAHFDLAQPHPAFAALHGNCSADEACLHLVGDDHYVACYDEDDLTKSIGREHGRNTSH